MVRTWVSMASSVAVTMSAGPAFSRMSLVSSVVRGRRMRSEAQAASSVAMVSSRSMCCPPSPLLCRAGRSGSWYGSVFEGYEGAASGAGGGAGGGDGGGGGVACLAGYGGFEAEGGEGGAGGEGVGLFGGEGVEDG